MYVCYVRVDCDVSTKIQEEIKGSLDGSRPRPHQGAHLGLQVEPPAPPSAVRYHSVSSLCQTHVQDHDPAAVQPSAEHEESLDW